MRKKAVLFIIVVIIFAVALQGVVPRKWELRSKEDFYKGKFSGVSLSFDGILSLSPKETEIEGPAEEFYLSLLITPRGIVYLGTGHGGKIYNINTDGKTELYFTVPEMDVYCLVQDKKGNLYAGTSPNGKIYKITAKNKGTVFFNPGEKYIWDLSFVDNNTLLAAVGETGGIYQINSEGEGKLILRAEENHILCLKKDSKGNLFAGSGGHGLLYRISQQGKASVLFESPYEEIKSIVFDEEGNIFAAAGGTISRPIEEKIPRLPQRTEADIIVTVYPESSSGPRLFSPEKNQPGALYRISPEGMAKRIWQSREDQIYTLLWNKTDKKLIFGTGNRGRIFSVDRNEKISLLLEKDSEQVYGLYPSASRIYMISNNPSRLSLVHSQQRTDGEYLSRVFDTSTVSSWGRIGWIGELPTGTSIQIQTRSGNSREPGKTWSDWSPPYQKKEGEMILSPRARYLQFKVLFKTQSGRVSPSVSKMNLFYLQTNIAPTFTKLELLPANQVFIKPPERGEVIWGLEKDISQKTSTDQEPRTQMMMKKTERKGFQTLTWETKDENGDNLLYKLFIKKKEESRWRVLKEQWTDKIFAFDTLSFPDGVYFVKVAASDTLSNPLGMEKQSEKISQPLIIDNSLPLIKNFKLNKNKNLLEITFEAEDLLSYIEEVKYLIRPGEWHPVFPVDGISDSKQESFKLSIKLEPDADNLITIKVKDSRDNVGVYRKSF